ncbi:NTP transferase domain-containing protein [Shewanella aquimarina]|uniref:NTP transferase domain-containing protein n=1 Tax=Shewanella aquimarina TaxID=260365 RepID=UPI002014ECE2|nr:NTP transferase domain-containing protein [Shewanella aquimarina]MCL2911434.1 NTP transferase domain-containing protein [Shewanella aquimarina]
MSMKLTDAVSYGDDDNPSLTLVIMAAGLGSRFGGDKQLAELGPKGETMLQLSIASAIKAGFSAAVIVTRSELIPSLEARLADLPGGFALQFCVQQMTDLPESCRETVQGDKLAELTNARRKPWGTAHALWSARKLVAGPMAVINADDYYGDQAFALLAQGFQQRPDKWQMVAYPLKETLSDHGGVNRGICVTQDNLLISVEEWLNIAWQGDNLVGSHLGRQGQLSPEAMASMTCWGFTPDILDLLGDALADFVAQPGQAPNSECYLPAVVQAALSAEANAKQVFVSQTLDTWLGVTYPQDIDWVKQKLMELLGD